MAHSKFKMSDAEIMDYMDAATDPLKALDVLAVKNRTTRAIMRAYLGELGIVVEEPEKPAPPVKSSPPPNGRRGGWHQSLIDDEKALAMYNAGSLDKKIAAAMGVTPVSVCKWRQKRNLPSNYKPGGGRTKGEVATVKDERPVEDAVIEEDAQRERAFEEILESVDAGKRAREKSAEDAPTKALSGYVVPQPVRAAERDDLTVGEFLTAFSKYLTETVAAAPLRINGVALHRDMEFSVRVKSELVFVDLRTQEAG